MRMEEYATSPLFTEADRAALDYVTELTRDKKVNPGHLCAAAQAFLRARHLRDRVAGGQRARLQHDQSSG